MNLEDQIKELVEEFLPDASYFVTDVVAKAAGSKTKVSVFLDGDSGVDIGVCASINRQLGNRIEKDNVIQHSYTLEVSSAGIDRPLKLLRQYQKNVGRKVRITLTDSQLEGILQEVNKEFVTINSKTGKEQEIHEVPFSKIVKTQVLVSF